MYRKALWGSLAISLLLLASISPVCGANYESKSELQGPDEIYWDVEGPSASETKDENRTGGGGTSPSTGTYNVTVDSIKKGSTTTERSRITFPYQKFNWSIGTWYRTYDGLRFYDVSYRGEKILYDYRLPWVKIGNTKYSLTSSICVDGPDLTIFNSQEKFKVWVKYHIDSEDTDIEVYVYFSERGGMDPWAIVDCNNVDKDITVGQRFDFDLGGAGDDNAQFFEDTPLGDKWVLVEEEDDHPDGGQPENNSAQWRLFDTDRDGQGFTYDQIAKIIPYHPDDSSVTILRYHGSQVRGDPSDYDNDETTGLYSGPTYDPYIGYDLVAWYVAVYPQEDWCNPGPWILLEV